MRQGRLVTALLVVFAALISSAVASGASSVRRIEPDPSTQGITTGVTTVRELPALRTEDSDTFLQSDGSRLLQIADHPVNFKRNGTWQPIEDQLVPAPGGSWEPAASPVPVNLPVGLGGHAVTVGGASRRLSLALQGAEGASGVATRNTRSYSAVLDHVDASYAATPRGIRETLTLADASAPAEFKYSLSLAEGLHATLERGGSVTIRDSQGQIAYTIAAPTIEDSSGRRHLPSTAPVHFTLNAARTVLTLLVDKAWLASPARVFPVKIDPDVYFGALKDCTIASSSTYENRELCGDPLFVGHNSETSSTGRALLQYNLSSVPRGSQILSSSIAMWLRSATPGTPIQIDAYGLNPRAFTSSVTWNSYDGTYAWTTPGGDHLKTLAGSTLVKPEYEGGWVSIGFSPQVEQWVRDPTSNFGILLKAHNEAVNATDEFIQTANGESEPEPDIHIVYEPQMGNPPNEAMFEEPIGNNDTLAVNVANGNLHITAPDANYATEGYDTQLARSYNSADDEHVTASIGNGWGLSMGEDTLLYPAWWDGSNVFHEPDGSYTRFDRAPWADNHPASGDEAYTGDAYRPETLVKHENDTRTLTYNDTGVKWQFDNSGNGFPQKIEDPGGEGNTISLGYTESRLTKVTDTHGHELNLTRNPTTHRVSKIKGAGSGEEWKYTYSEGNLAEYKGPGGQEAKYTNTGPYNEISAITDPSGTTVISYDEHNRVTSLRHVVNGTISTVGSEDETTTFSYETEQTTVTHPDATTDSYTYDQFGNVTEEPGTQEEASEFYAAFAGIEPEVARADVDLQSHASILNSELDQQLGDAYTGEWFDPATGRVKVGLTSEGYEQTVEQDLDNLGLADNADIVTASASWAQLETAAATLGSSLTGLAESGAVSVGIDPSHDAVRVLEANSLTAGEKAEVTSATASASVPTEIVVTGQETLLRRPKGCSEGACGPPLRGGVQIRDEGADYACTAGYVARGEHDGKPYLLTAGHCIYESKTGGVGHEWATKTPGLFEFPEIGKAVSYVDGQHQSVPGGTTSKGDAGLIEIHNTVYSRALAPLVIQYGNSAFAKAIRNERYVITGTHFNPHEHDKQLQFVVCAGGVGAKSAQEERCGVTEGFEREVHEPKGIVIHNQERVNFCNSKQPTGLTPGTSGAPVYKGHEAVGLVTAGGSDASECETFYQGINTAEHVLHVHIVRAG
jgi:YD repeat-containing protein